MANLILSIRPEAFYMFVFIVGIIVLNVFILKKFFQMAGDIRKISETLTKVLIEINKKEGGK